MKLGSWIVLIFLTVFGLQAEAHGPFGGASGGSGTPASSSITEAMLKVIDAAADEECLTYESGGGGDFEWQPCRGSIATTYADMSSGTSIICPAVEGTLCELTNSNNCTSLVAGNGALCLYYDGVWNDIPQPAGGVDCAAGETLVQHASGYWTCFPGALTWDLTNLNWQNELPKEHLEGNGRIYMRDFWEVDEEWIGGGASNTVIGKYGWQGQISSFNYKSPQTFAYSTFGPTSGPFWARVGSTTTPATGGTYLRLGDSAYHLLGGETWEAVVVLEDLATRDVEEFIVVAGMTDIGSFTLPAAATDGVYFLYDIDAVSSGSIAAPADVWQACIGDGVDGATPTPLCVTTGVTPATKASAAPDKLRIVVNANRTAVTFYVNAATPVTMTTDIPVADSATSEDAMTPFFLISNQESAGVNENYLYIDYMHLYGEMSTPRW